MILSTIRSLAEAGAAYFEFKTKSHAYDALKNARKERTEIEERMVEVSTESGIHDDVRSRLIDILDHRLRESHDEIGYRSRICEESERRASKDPGPDRSKLPKPGKP